LHCTGVRHQTVPRSVLSRHHTPCSNLPHPHFFNIFLPCKSARCPLFSYELDPSSILCRCFSSFIGNAFLLFPNITAELLSILPLIRFHFKRYKAQQGSTCRVTSILIVRNQRCSCGIPVPLLTVDVGPFSHVCYFQFTNG
jgi:hypothetical protein